jgi:uncharacterized protein
MQAIELLKQHENIIKSKFHVKSIGIFGSFIRDDQKDESDVDVLVTFEPGFKTFDNFMELKFYLEDIFVREIDLVTLEALRPQLKDYILQEVVYA